MIPLLAKHCSLLLEAARRTLRGALSGQELAEIVTDDPALLQPAGSFVSLHEYGTRRLRGCVGRLEARSPLIVSVQHNAACVLEDPRFVHRRVTLGELPNLEVEVSILSPLQPAISPLGFDPLEHGLYLMVGDRAGCFLPQVGRETGWTREQLLARLCTEKMGLPPTMWNDPIAKLFLFTAVILGPELCVFEDVNE